MERGAESHFRCPECRSSDVVRVSVAYERDVTINSTEFAGIGASKGGFAIGGGISETKGRSVFAQKLEPPKLVQPKISTGIAAACFGLVAITIALPPLAMLTIPGGIFALYKPFKAHFAAQQKAKADHELAMQEWAKQWVCCRCGELASIENFRTNSNEGSQP